MYIEVGADITIKEPTKEVLQWVKSELILDNPDFFKKEKMGKWTGNTPRKIWLYEHRSGMLRIPFGELRKLWTLHSVKSDWNIKIGDLSARKYNSRISLYDYQETALNRALAAKNGVLVMPCGSGKTQTGLEIIARVGGRALWLTHTQDLLNQSYNRAKAVLDIDGSYGRITAGKVDIGTHITFATVQTMCKLDLTQYKDAFDVIIVDEAQHCYGSPTRVTQFYKVVTNLSARYKIGLTATPKRADGLERAMFALLGGVIHEVTKDEVKHTTCPIRIDVRETGYMPDYNAVLTGDGTLDYTAIVGDMISNKERYAVILDAVRTCQTSVLTLANRISYIERLDADFRSLGGKSVCLSTLGNSKKAKEARKKALEQLNNGELDAVFATYQLAKEGLDVPNLKYVIFATPEKDETTVIQSVGRVGRKADGKEYGTVIDFVDDFGMYRGWAKKRRAYYKKIDATIL